jgi:N6-L-threonylcarbamoyladenine synthase
VAETLTIKSRRALQQTRAGTLVVAGGVGANRRLRELLARRRTSDGFRLAFPRPEFCTDNGAMIAFAGALRLAAGQREDATIRVAPRWDLESLPAL